MSEGFGGDFTSANRLAGHWKDDGDDDDEGGGGDEGNEKSPWLQTSTSQLWYSAVGRPAAVSRWHGCWQFDWDISVVFLSQTRRMME